MRHWFWETKLWSSLNICLSDVFIAAKMFWVVVTRSSSSDSHPVMFSFIKCRLLLIQVWSLFECSVMDTFSYFSRFGTASAGRWLRFLCTFSFGSHRSKGKYIAFRMRLWSEHILSSMSDFPIVICVMFIEERLMHNLCIVFQKVFLHVNDRVIFFFKTLIQIHLWLNFEFMTFC